MKMAILVIWMYNTGMISQAVPQAQCEAMAKKSNELSTNLHGAYCLDYLK